MSLASALAAETWTWYGLTWLVVVARMSSRILLRGSIRKLQKDDALIMFAMLTDTVLMVGINIIASTNSNLIDPNDKTPLTPESIKEREFGSKMVLVVEQMQILTVWAVKGCLLIMYNRLTMSLKQNLAVKIVSCYVIIGLVVMEILYFGVWCRPFEQYWAVPPDNVQCSAATNHLITNTAFNISSDIMIILIPMPVFLRSHLPPKKKAILCAVFALGGFTILSAILNKFYSFNEPFGTSWTFWYIRESSTALITANLPMTWTLFQRVFRLRSFDAKSTNPHSGGPNSGFRSGYGPATSTLGRRGDDAAFDRTSSQEQINKAYDGHDIPLKIYQRHEVEITSQPAPSGDGRHSSQESVPSGGRGVAHVYVQGGSSPPQETSSNSAVRVYHGV